MQISNKMLFVTLFLVSLQMCGFQLSAATAQAYCSIRRALDEGYRREISFSEATSSNLQRRDGLDAKKCYCFRIRTKRDERGNHEKQPLSKSRESWLAKAVNLAPSRREDRVVERDGWRGGFRRRQHRLGCYDSFGRGVVASDALKK